MQMIAVRLHEGDDLKQAIENFVKTNALSSATIISAVGSLTQVRMRMAGAQPDAQDIRTLSGPFEIVSLIGNLGQGRSHLHIAVSDKDGAVHGGHLKEASIVHTTVELVLATESQLTFTEKTDPQTGFGELHIEP
ncbi:MAG TPA: PPC domain-containing DNA-binding protein [Candidatus Saccharimonas sp.]|nr:PPC domain-containing DNA-binding protein [Candidatus Saccharimonas sp.]